MAIKRVLVMSSGSAVSQLMRFWTDQRGSTVVMMDVGLTEFRIASAQARLHQNTSFFLEITHDFSVVPAQWPCGRESALRLRGWVQSQAGSYQRFEKGDPVPPCLVLSIKGWIGDKSLRHTSVMSRGCTCTSSCLTLQTQEIGSCPMGLIGSARLTYI